MASMRHPARGRVLNPAPLPIWIAIIGIVGICALVLPLAGMGREVPWTRIPALVGTQAAQDALWLSLRTCLAATVIDLVLGVPLAVLLARQWRGVKVARVLVLLPLSLPPVVAGLALLATFGRRGMVGAPLQAAGVTVAFSTTAVVMSQVFVSMPFLVTTLESAIRTRAWGLEETAAALGAGPTRVLATITAPTMLPALARGTALAAARCLGEFGATITFAGSLQGTTETMPLEIYLARETDSDTALALGVILVAVGAIVVALTQWEPGKRRHRHARPVRRSRTVATAHDTPPARPASVQVSGRIAARDWDVDLNVEAGQIVAVMGPNGAGKSTLAAVITGLLGLDDGQVHIGGALVDDGVAGRPVPPRRRGAALLTQQARVFGHMSVLDNVAYGPRAHGVPRRRALAIADQELAAVGCADLATRRGDELSGGQAARVGLARALAAGPGVLVLDEPTASLDVESRAAVQRALAARLALSGTTTLMITHDVMDAVQVATRLVVLDHGRVVDQGSPQQLLSRPGSSFTARLAGLNLVQGTGCTTPDDLAGIRVGDRRLAAAPEPGGCPRSGDGRPVAAMFAPEAVALYRQDTAGSPRTSLPAVVAGVEESGGLVSVLATLASGDTIRARITLSAWAELGLCPGDDVWCAIKATQVRLVPQQARRPAAPEPVAGQ